MLLKNKKINREKILHHGFKVEGENFIRTEKFLDDFALTIIIDKRGTVTKTLNELVAHCFDDEKFFWR